MGCWDEKGIISHLGINGSETKPIHCFIATTYMDSDSRRKTVALGPSIKGRYNTYGTLEHIIEDESTEWWELQFNLPIEVILNHIERLPYVRLDKRDDPLTDTRDSLLKRCWLVFEHDDVVKALASSTNNKQGWGFFDTDYVRTDAWLGLLGFENNLLVGDPSIAWDDGDFVFAYTNKDDKQTILGPSFLHVAEHYRKHPIPKELPLMPGVMNGDISFLEYAEHTAMYRSLCTHKRNTMEHVPKRILTTMKNEHVEALQIENEEILDYASLPDTPHVRESLMFIVGMGYIGMDFRRVHLAAQDFYKPDEIYHLTAIAESLKKVLVAE